MNFRWLFYSRPSEQQQASAVLGFRRYLYNLTLQRAENPGPTLEQLRGLRCELNTLIEWLEKEQAEQKAELKVRRSILARLQPRMAEGKEHPCS